MSGKKWSEVKRVFYAAIAVEPSSRDEAIERECGGDTALAAEVRILLSASDRGASLFERPAAELLAEWSVPGPPERLGPWRIERPIGSGGMADVYLAERCDGQFHKRVAVKVLRDGLYGAEARARFAREQQVLADLDHPDIVRLLDAGVTGDHRPYFVMDFVDGVGIVSYARAQHLSRRERLDLFLRVCEAVSYAHGRGVVHRDLKPANILVASGGTVKLLDFGIAKLLEADYSGRDSTSTNTRCFTPEYASPEQVRGEPVTVSTDVYSLGLVLFELLLGQRPFDLDTLAPYEASRIICERMPDTARLPRRLARIVKKAIRKAARERYAGIDDFAAEIRRYIAAPGSEWVSGRLIKVSAGVTLATIIAAGSAVLFMRWTRSPEPARVLPPVFERLTGYPGTEEEPSLSPDGKTVVFRRTGGGKGGLWLLDIASGVASQLTTTEDMSPQWSPKRDWIAFSRRAGNDLFDLSLINPRGGPVRTLARIQGVFMSWDPDGTALAYADRPTAQEPFAIYRIPITGGAPRKLSDPATDSWGDINAMFSPDGRRLALLRYASKGNGDLYVMPSNGGEVRRITEGEGWINGFAWAPDGKDIIYAPTRSTITNKYGLWRVSAGLHTRTQSSLIATPGLGGSPSHPSVAAGRLVFQVDTWRSNLWRMPLGSGASALPLRLLGSDGIEENPAYSPDGKRLAFWGNLDGDDEIWTVNTDGSNPIKVSHTHGLLTRNPSWSPDGSHIAYVSNINGKTTLFVVPSSGGDSRRLPIGNFEAGSPSWARNSRYIYFRCELPGASQICRIGSDGLSDVVPITRNGGVEAFTSRTGELFFTRSHDYGKLFTIPESGGRERELPGSPTVIASGWQYINNGIYFLEVTQGKRGDSIPVRRFDIATHRVESLGAINEPALLKYEISVRPDGKEIAWTRMERGADLILLDNFH